MSERKLSDAIAVISEITGIPLDKPEDLAFTKGLQGLKRDTMIWGIAANLKSLQTVGGFMPEDRIRAVPKMNLEEAKKFKDDALIAMAKAIRLEIYGYNHATYCKGYDGFMFLRKNYNYIPDDKITLTNHQASHRSKENGREI